MKISNLLFVLKGYLKTYIGAISNIVFASLFVTIIGMNWPYLYKIIVNKVFILKSIDIALFVVLLYVIMFSVEKFLQFLWRYSDAMLATDLLDDIRSDVYKKLFEIDGIKYSKISTGEIIDILETDTQNLFNLITIDGIHTLTSAIRFIMSILYISYMNLWLGMIVLFLIPMTYFFIKYINNKIHPIQSTLKEKQEEYNIWFLDVLSGIKTIKIFGAVDYFVKKLFLYLEKLAFLDVEVKRDVNKLNSIVSLINLLADLLIYGLSSYFIISNKMLIGDFVAIMIYFNWAKVFFERMNAYFVNKNKNILSLKRIINFLNLPSENGEGKNLVYGDIIYENVSFSYGAICVLDHFTLHIEKGKWHAIVGESGCGKSTALKLLSRIYEIDSGKVYVGEDEITSISLNELRTNIAVVRQDSSIFNKTILFNLTLGDNSFVETDLWKVLEVVELSHIFRQMKDGLKTIIGNNNLSQGQEQRLTIARALLHSKKYIIFDEATSNIEYDLERRLMKRIRTDYPQVTIIIVAYRWNIVSLCDRVHFMEKGKIIKSGSPKEMYDQYIKFRKIMEVKGEGEYA